MNIIKNTEGTILNSCCCEIYGAGKLHHSVYNEMSERIYPDFCIFQHIQYDNRRKFQHCIRFGKACNFRCCLRTYHNDNIRCVRLSEKESITASACQKGTSDIYDNRDNGIVFRCIRSKC